MARIKSMLPVVGNKPRVLILGTMPGKTSLEMQEYYAYKHNQFWELIYAIFDKSPGSEYAARTEFLKSRSVALWDVVCECNRGNSSADAAIKEEKPNDIPALLKRHTSIRYIFFNGMKAEDLFKKYYGGTSRQEMCRLPSSSPANVRYTFKKKLEEWRKIKVALDKQQPRDSDVYMSK